MSKHGEPDGLLLAARSGLLVALEALESHRDSGGGIGAQAIYLRTESAPGAVAEATKGSDLALDPRSLDDDPRIEAAMAQGGFARHENGQPGQWVNAVADRVDLMVPESLADDGGKRTRGARIKPHHEHAMRRARGLEAAVVDNERMTVPALDAADERAYEVRVAGSAALLVAKAHKIGDRDKDAPERLVDKDAHDLYRILVATETEVLSAGVRRLFSDRSAREVTKLSDRSAREVTKEAIDFLRKLFAAGRLAVGSMMVGRAEEGVGEPETVALQTSILTADLLARTPPGELTRPPC